MQKSSFCNRATAGSKGKLGLEMWQELERKQTESYKNSGLENQGQIRIWNVFKDENNEKNRRN